jgi:four helix bundle protein
MKAKLSGFEKLDAYQESYRFAMTLYKLLERFELDNPLLYQLKRSAISIPLNIAEGTGALTKRDYLNYVNISYKSLLEVKASLALCMDLKYITNKEFKTIMDLWWETREILYGLRLWLMKRCSFRKGDKLEFQLKCADALDKNLDRQGL